MAYRINVFTGEFDLVAEVSAMGGVTQVDGDSGSATPTAGVIDILGGSGITTVGSGNDLTVSLDLTEEPTLATTYGTDSGNAVPAANILNILGGTGASTSGSGDTITITASGSTPLSFPTDSGTGTPAANALNILGGTGISTSAAGDTVSITNDGILSPGAVTDEAIVRWDGITGTLVQNSVVTITDAGIIDGITQLNVDNLRLDGNDISSTDTNGNITLTPDGTGIVSTMSALSVGGVAETGITIGGVAIDGTVIVHTEGATDLAELLVERHSNTAGFGAHLVFARSRGTEASETIVQSGDVLSQLPSVGHDGTDYELAANIRVEVDGTPGAGDMPGRIVFLTTPDGSATPVEGMRLSEDATLTLANALPVGSGGTANTTFTAYSVICAGTTATGAFQNVSGVGTAAQVLTSNGAAALPTWQDAAADALTITGDSGGALSPTASNWNILGLGETSTSGSVSTLSLLSPRTAQFIVDPTVNNGTHQTIASAISAASAGDTIFIRPGIYTEDLTLTVGINLCSYTADAFTPNVTILGKCTLTTAGSVTISGIRLETNSDFAVVVSGSVASVLNLVNCYLNCSDATGISLTSSSSSSQINLINCNGDVGTTLIKLYEVTGAGSLFFDRSYITNSGSTVTASTSSAGFVFWQYSYSELPITTSATSVMSASYTFFSTFTTNQLILTQGGSSNNVFRRCTFKSGTATAITISSGLNLDACHFELANADVVAGAGTLTYGLITVNNTVAWGMSVSTQVQREVGPDLKVGSTLSGGANTLTVNNNSNTASSDAVISITSGGTSAGDPFVTYNVPATTDWSHGIDNTDSDAWVLSASTAPGTTNVIHATTAGEVTKPLQPAFLSVLDTTDSNVTGDGTFAQLGAGNALTEIFDQGGDVTTGGVFTAPVTGRYFMGSTTYVSGLTSSHTTGYMQISASNRAFDSFYVNSYAAGTAGNEIMMNLSCFVDMDAADTVAAYVRIQSGTKVVDIIGGSNADTSFFGHLVC